ncbi:unnamed protein product, partial [Tetraodon nigroviridis]
EAIINTPPLTIDGAAVERVSSTKFLGVHISEDLSWTTNTASLAKKAQQRFYFLRKLKWASAPGTIESILSICITNADINVDLKPKQTITLNHRGKSLKEDSLALLDCAIKIRRTLRSTENPPYTDQYLLFDSNHLLEHKLGVIKHLQHRAKKVPTTSELPYYSTQNMWLPRLGLHRDLQKTRPQQRRREKQMSQCFYPLPGWSSTKIQENLPKTQHSCTIQTLQHTQTETSTPQGQDTKT